MTPSRMVTTYCHAAQPDTEVTAVRGCFDHDCSVETLYMRSMLRCVIGRCSVISQVKSAGYLYSLNK